MPQLLVLLNGVCKTIQEKVRSFEFQYSIYTFINSTMSFYRRKRKPSIVYCSCTTTKLLPMPVAGTRE